VPCLQTRDDDVCDYSGMLPVSHSIKFVKIGELVYMIYDRKRYDALSVVANDH